MKAKDMIDAQASAQLRLVLRTRLDFIDEVYPKIGSADRQHALEQIIHLINELGYDLEDFLK